MTTDKERLDLLQELTEGYGGGWVLRCSLNGRGWRLHESSGVDATPNVRDAIDRKMVVPWQEAATEGEEKDPGYSFSGPTDLQGIPSDKPVTGNDWYEVGGQHQIPIITVPLSMAIGIISGQIDEMSKSDLEWLKLAASNLELACKIRIEELDASEESEE